MEEIEYRKMFAYEDRHWWFRGKRAIVGRMIERFADTRGRVRSLDVGCGTGANLRLLQQYGPAFGLDLHPLALELCRKRGIENILRGSALQLPYRDEQFDVVTMLDVLYHRNVSDVRRSLREGYRVCKPGGLLVVTDSACESLRSGHDVAYHGARRFRRGALGRELEACGFSVVKSSYMNSLLFPIALGARVIEKLRYEANQAHSSLGRPVPVVNGILAKMYEGEAGLLRYVDLPFGLSVLLVGRKAAQS